MTMSFILAIVFLNGIISFTYSIYTAQETATLWSMLTVNFLFFVGVTQTGIAFSTIMRISKSSWSKYYSRLGEVMTLAFAPIAIITFIIIYLGGTEHIFYWASEHSVAGGGGHVSPWLGKGLFFWKNIISMVVFYFVSYIYFRMCRIEEKGKVPSDGIEKKLNVLATLVMGAYIITNSCLAWDFGMTFIPHWESPIYAPYIWVGNVFGGTAFLFMAYVFFKWNKVRTAAGSGKHIGLMGKLLLGYSLLWTYMWWSQYFVLWYGDIPVLTGPLLKKMQGNYAALFYVMVVTLLVIPFLGLIQRRVKNCTSAMTVIAILICVGIWIDRYLMILPVLSDGSEWIIATWTNLSLVFGGLSAAFLSVIAFLRLFPDVKVIRE